MPNTVPTPTHDVRQQEGVYTPLSLPIFPDPTRKSHKGPRKWKEQKARDGAHRNYGSLPTMPVWPMAVALTLSTASRLKTSRSGKEATGQQSRRRPDQKLPDQGSALSRGTGLQVFVETGGAGETTCQGAASEGEMKRRGESRRREAACRGPHLPQSPPAAREGRRNLPK